MCVQARRFAPARCCHFGGFARGRMHVGARPGDRLGAIAIGADGIAQEEVGVLGASDRAVAGETIRAESEGLAVRLDAHRQCRNAMLDIEEGNLEAADLARRARAHDVQADLGMLRPFGKAARRHRADAFMRVGVGVDVERDAGEQQRLDAAGMIQMPVRDDDVADGIALEADLVHLPDQLEAAAGVDHERRAAGRGDDHACRGPVGMERRTRAEHGHCHRHVGLLCHPAMPQADGADRHQRAATGITRTPRLTSPDGMSAKILAVSWRPAVAGFRLP